MAGGGTLSSLKNRSNSSGSTERRGAPSSPKPEERIKRCMSVSYGSETKSILKYRTVDESLHNITNTMTKESNNRAIAFGEIAIREYGRTLGDNPSCSSGPPVSISWEYKVVRKMSVEDFEGSRPARRTQMEMVLPRRLRSEMLRKDWDVSQRQIAEAVRQNVKIKNQRRTTVNNLGKASNLELIMESFTRNVKRTLMFQKSVSSQCKELEAKHNEAMRRKRQRLREAQMADEHETQFSGNSKEAKDSIVDENTAMEEKSEDIFFNSETTKSVVCRDR